MIKTAPAILKEMLLGLCWPINAALTWALGWRPAHWVKTFELVAVAVAIAVVVIEFRIDRPRDRAVP